MLNEILVYLKNYFEVDKLYGKFNIEDGFIRYADGRIIPLKERQYIRIIGSVLNDGVYQYFEDTPMDFVGNEAFNGSVWRLAIPQDILSLAEDITAWRGKYEHIDAPTMSPYQSESFGGYSYSKQTPSNGSNGSSWMAVYGDRLKRYRKI